MSWTIETQTPENEDMKKLESAISAAEAAKTLMFCSASDQGGNSMDGCFPGDWDKCIKIGGATSTGEILPWVQEKKINFLLPGKKIPFTNPDGSTFTESGSSVATAAASGLAGLLIFCDRLLGPGHRQLLPSSTEHDGGFQKIVHERAKIPARGILL